MHTDEPITSVVLWISHFDCDPEEVSAFLNVRGRVTRKGDPFLNVPGGHRFNSWQLGSRLQKRRNINEHIRDIYAQLPDDMSLLANLSRKFECADFLIGMSHPGCQATIRLDASVLKTLGNSKLGISFDFLVNWDCEEIEYNKVWTP